MKLNPILLETKITTNILRENGSLIKFNSNPNFRKQIGDEFQHIYLIDIEAEIKEGDWLIEKGLIINKFPNYLTDLEECSKIIASTDSSLELPLLSEQSIKLLIEYYDKNEKMPESIEIKEEDESPEPYENINTAYHYTGIKLNSQGTVDISIPEEQFINIGTDENGCIVANCTKCGAKGTLMLKHKCSSSIPEDRMYSRDDVISKIHEAIKAWNYARLDEGCLDINKWIKENLK